MNKKQTNNYLLLDYGNSCIKAALYNKQIKRCITVSNKTSFASLLKQAKFTSFNKVIMISSASSNETKSFINQINKVCKNIYLVEKKDFIKDIDLSNVNKDVVIGNDILLCAYYLIKNYKSNALLCLGTVYFCVITKGNKILSVQLTPNISTGLEAISKITSIPSSLIPDNYNKDIGLNTPDAFACGAKTMLEGYIDLIAKKHNLNPKQIIVSGGEAIKFKSLSKKYNFIVYASLDALAQLVKDKNL